MVGGGALQVQVAAMRSLGQCGRPICGKGPAHHAAAECIQRRVQNEVQALGRTPKRGDVSRPKQVRSLGRQQRLRAKKIFALIPALACLPVLIRDAITWSVNGTTGCPHP